MKKLLFLVILGLPLACVEHDLPVSKTKGEDYVVFGDFYGFCDGRCVRMYLLTDNSLFADSGKNYPSLDIPFEGDFSRDLSKRFSDVEEIFSSIPRALIDSKENIVGCPDCADGGGLYFETRVNGDVRFWLIDKTRVPQELNAFVTLLNEKIALLQ
jgi:hypothetical protein